MLASSKEGDVGGDLGRKKATALLNDLQQQVSQLQLHLQN